MNHSFNLPIHLEVIILLVVYIFLFTVTKCLARNDLEKEGFIGDPGLRRYHYS